MYEVDLTGAFAGVFPSSIPVARRNFAPAVAFYKRALAASDSSRGGKGRLSSAHGFSFSVVAVSRSGASIRLQLPRTTDHVRVARRLAGGGTVFRDRRGIVVTDPFGVTWVVA